MSQIHIDIISAEQAVFHGQAASVSLPGEAGSLGILPGHTPLISKIKPGVVSIELLDGKVMHVFVAGGILEVQPKHVTVLADTAVRAEDLDELKVKQAKQNAEELLQNKASDLDIAKAQAEIAVAVAQLAAIARLRHKNY